MDAVDAALREATGILYVCSGNAVRSAFAELYSRHVGLSLAVRSAATRFRNAGLFPETAAALASRGVPRAWIEGFRSTHLDDCLAGLDGRFVVLGMTPEHLSALAPRADLAPRGFLLGGLVPSPDGPRIPDPVLDGADFARTFRRVGACVDELARRLAGTADAGDLADP